METGETEGGRSHRVCPRMAHTQPHTLTLCIVYCAITPTLCHSPSPPGVDTGPIKLIEAGLLDDIQNLGWEVDFDAHQKFDSIDEKDDPPIGILKKPRLV